MSSQRYKWMSDGMVESNGGKWVKHSNTKDRAYKLLLAYAECAGSVDKDNYIDILQGHGWNPAEMPSYKFVHKLHQLALAAAKEAE